MRVFGVFLSLNGLLFILCEREKFYYFLFLLDKYHQRQVALATADDMQRLIHRNLVLLVSAYQAHLIHS